MGRNRIKGKTLFRVLLILLALVFTAAALYGEEAASTAAGGADPLLALAAMGAVGISCLTSAYALAKIGSAAMGAMAEKPEVGGRALVFLGMAEGIAIYGLIVAIMILNKI